MRSCFAHCFCNSRQSSPQGAGSQEEARLLNACSGGFLLTPFPTDLIKGTVKHGLTVEDLIMTGINYLDSRSDFWRQQKPIYARERDRKLMQEKWLRNRKRSPSQTAHYILKSLEDIDMRGWGYPQRGGDLARWEGNNSVAQPPASLDCEWGGVGVGGDGCSPQTGRGCSHLPITSLPPQC